MASCSAFATTFSFLAIKYFFRPKGDPVSSAMEKKAVSTGPGQMAVTKICLLRSSSLSARVKEST